MWKCPECKGSNLEVSIECSARLIQSDDNFETDTTDSIDGGHHWDDRSIMMCLDCVHAGEAQDFEVEG